MKKFEGMLFCTDLDGTLYAGDHTVSRENLDAIEYFKAEGGLFTFITGRVPKTSAQVCRTVAPNAPYGCLNGGGIFDPEKDDYLWYNVLPEEMLELVAEVDRCLPEIGIQFSTRREVCFAKDNGAMRWFRKLTGLPMLSCDYRELKELTPKFSFYIHDFMADELAPGVLHCSFANGFYTHGRIDGVSPKEWLEDAMNGKLYDVGMGLLEDK